MRHRKPPPPPRMAYGIHRYMSRYTKIPSQPRMGKFTVIIAVYISLVAPAELFSTDWMCGRDRSTGQNLKETMLDAEHAHANRRPG